MRALLVIDVMMATSAPECSAQTSAAMKWTPRRTADGQPDFEGNWATATLTPLERPPEFAGKDARALMVEPHSSGGRLKIGRSALDRRTLYRGVMQNHLAGQVTGFHAFDRDAYHREDDLYDAAMYAALVSLGDGTEARWSRL